MNIIGISGFAGSGKDTVADMLLDNRGFIKVSLADPIKRFAMDTWGFSELQLWGSSEQRNAPDLRYPIRSENHVDYLSARKALQHIGTEGTRAIDYDVWIRYAINVSTKLLTEPGWYYTQSKGLQSLWWKELFPFSFLCKKPKIKAVVIPDVRFANEIKYIKQNKGILIRVFRPGAGLSGGFELHQSEMEMSSLPDSEFDIVIDNSGTLDDLRQKVNHFVTKIV